MTKHQEALRALETLAKYHDAYLKSDKDYTQEVMLQKKAERFARLASVFRWAMWGSFSAFFWGPLVAPFLPFSTAMLSWSKTGLLMGAVFLVAAGKMQEKYYACLSKSPRLLPETQEELDKDLRKMLMKYDAKFLEDLRILVKSDNYHRTLAEDISTHLNVLKKKPKKSSTSKDNQVDIEPSVDVKEEVEQKVEQKVLLRKDMDNLWK